MVVRLRNSGRAGVVAVIVAIALCGSALIAYAAKAPSGGTYPTTFVKISGHGFVTAGTTKAAFEIEVVRNSSGSTVGEVKIVTFTPGVATVSKFKHPRPPRPHISIFKSESISALNVSGNSATFTATGRLDKQDGAVANISVTDNPDTFGATIMNGSTIVLSVSGPVHLGGISIKTLTTSGYGHGHGHGH